MTTNRSTQHRALPRNAVKAGIAPAEFVCLGANVRRAERLITQLYDDAMRGSGLRMTQYSLLNNLIDVPARPEGYTLPELARRMGSDVSTLSRNLALLRRRGMVQATTGEDRRVVRFRTTPAGRNAVAKARPGWEKTQARLARLLGERGWKQLRSTLNHLAHELQE